jgi:hypothetical protein
MSLSARYKFVERGCPRWSEAALAGDPRIGDAVARHDAGGTMIDDPLEVERVIARMKASLPLVAEATPALMATLREQAPKSRKASIDRVDYAGDEGGIVCGVHFDGADDSRAFHVSLTHLTIAPGQPLWREIEAYRKRRIKRLRRLAG